MHDQLTNKHIGFIGAGNMATSLIAGLLDSGMDKTHLHASEPNAERRHWLNKQYSIDVIESNQTLVARCDTVLLSVKPQVMVKVLDDIAAQVRQSKPLVISIAAGIPLSVLSDKLGEQAALVRVMPNTPAMVSAGIAGLYANTHCTAEQKQTAETILNAVGSSVWVNSEDQIDAVTALSGSGPAYFFLVIEALTDAGLSLGLNQETAQTLAIHTAFGAAKMALENDSSPATLREQVTSPGGTTERALEVLTQGNLKALFEHALVAAKARAKELAKTQS